MKTGLVLSILIFFLVAPSVVFSASDYVLPYPPVMPGNKMYKVRQASEYLQHIWSFGSFAQYKFNLEQADIYLVEAKTLFEYKQYLLADRALSRSNTFIAKAADALARAENEGKDISAKHLQFASAIEKHIEVLSYIKTYTPQEFAWQPEKEAATDLPIHSNLEKAIQLRRSCL